VGANRALLVGCAIVMLVLGGFVSYKAYSRD